MEENKKSNKLTKGETVLIGGLVLGATLIGFKAGSEHCEKCISRGIQKLWDVDITLKEHMYKTLCEYQIKN